MAVWAPQASSRREPEYYGTAMGCSWKRTLSELDAELDYHMEQKLWTLACALVLLSPRLNLFHCEMGRDGTLGSQEGNPVNFTSSVKFIKESHLPVWVSENSFPDDTTRSVFPLITIC